MSFGEQLAELFGVFPPELAVFLLSMSPVGEVRMSIPVGIIAFDMHWSGAFVWALLGNLMVVPLLTVALPTLERLMRRSKRTERMLEWTFERTRKKAGSKVNRYQEFAVFLFIATPLPGTGAWTGVVVSHLFGLPFKQSIRYYYAGIVAACIIATSLVQLGVLVL